MPGGKLIATRKHVIFSRDDLKVFLRLHPLQHLYGGESAYMLEEYVRAIEDAGIRLEKILNPLESEINMYPAAIGTVKASIARKFLLPAYVAIPKFFIMDWQT